MNNEASRDLLHMERNEIQHAKLAIIMTYLPSQGVGLHLWVMIEYETLQQTNLFPFWKKNALPGFKASIGLPLYFIFIGCQVLCANVGKSVNIICLYILVDPYLAVTFRGWSDFTT